MKTSLPKTSEIKRKWYLVDAKDKVLGRIATKIAMKLRGKDKPCFTPHLDCGDHVVIINADKILLTGNKLSDKIYYSHSKYPGALKKITAEKLLEKKPTEVIRKAISGMIPRNRLKKPMMEKLKIYAGEEHPHEAQKPETFKI